MRTTVVAGLTLLVLAGCSTPPASAPPAAPPATASSALPPNGREICTMVRDSTTAFTKEYSGLADASARAVVAAGHAKALRSYARLSHHADLSAQLEELAKMADTWAQGGKQDLVTYTSTLNNACRSWVS